MKYFIVCVCVCAIATFAQDDLGATSGTDSSEKADTFVDQLLKSLHVATTEDAADSSNQNDTSATSSSSTSLSEDAATAPVSSTTELGISTTDRESRAFLSSSKNALPNYNILVDFIGKLATIPPETFDRLMKVLNAPTTTETSTRSKFARNDIETSTPESNTPMLFTSEIDESVPAATTQDTRISDIISIISNVESSNTIDKTTTMVTTTPEPVITVLPIMTFENSSSDVVVVVGPYAPPIPSSRKNDVKSTTPIISTTTQSVPDVTTMESSTSSPSTTTALPVTTTSASTTSNGPLSNRVSIDTNSSKPYPSAIDPMTPYKPDFFVFGVLPNGTIVRKRPAIINPGVVIGVLPNDTLIQRFPNGSIAPLPTESVIQVDNFDTPETSTDGVYLARSLSTENNTASMLNQSTVAIRLSNESYIVNPDETLEEQLNNQSQTATSTTVNRTQSNVETATTEMANTTIAIATVSTTTPDTLLNSITSDENTLANPLALFPFNETFSPVTLMDMLTNNVSAIANSISIGMMQNMSLNDRQKEDLAKIESLLKRQQVLLEKLAVIAKMNLESSSMSTQGNLTERVMVKVMEMSMTTSTTTTTPVPPSVTATPLTTTTTTRPTLLTTEQKQITSESTTVKPLPTIPKAKGSKGKQIIITEKQIEVLINQLEAIKKNPEKIKKLDIEALKKLQKFENSMQNADDAAILQMIKMDVKLENKAELSNRLAELSTSTTTTARTTTTTSTTTTTTTAAPTTTVPPTTTQRSTSPKLKTMMDPEMREELLDYAINISQAISSFLGSALQEAQIKFVKSLVNSKNILKLDGLPGMKNTTMM